MTTKYPFSRAVPLGHPSGAILTAEQFNTVDDNASQAADGAVWTDFAIAQNWLGTDTVASHGDVLLWSDANRLWYSFGVSGGNPVVASKAICADEFTAGISITAGDGLTPLCAAESPTTMLLGGTPGSSSTKKLRVSTGGSWTVKDTAATGTSSVRGLVYHSGAELFIAGIDSAADTNIETSDDDGVTWTQQTGLPNTNPRGSIASSGTTAVILPYNTSTNKALKTQSGVTYEEVTLPATAIWLSVHWDSASDRFVAFNAAGGVAYSDDDGVTWSAASGTTTVDYEASANMGRVLLGADTSGSTIYIAQLQEDGTFEDLALRTIAGGPNIAVIATADAGIKQVMFSVAAGVHFWTIAGGSLFL